MSNAAISHNAKDGSIATSTAPSATNICDQKSPIPRVLHAAASIFWKGSRRSPHPTKSEYEIDASVSDEIFDTEIFFSLTPSVDSSSLSESTKSLFPELKRTVAPWPLAAAQRRVSAGAEAIPTTTSSLPAASTSTRAIKVAQVGTPRIKFLVPSIGSITQ